MNMSLGLRFAAKLLLPASLVVASALAIAQYNGNGPLPTPTSGTLKATSQRTAVASRVYPRKFFPRVNETVSPKNIVPENPSRLVPFPGDKGTGVIPGSSIRAASSFRGSAGRGANGPTLGGGTTPGGGTVSAGIFPGIGATGSAPPDTSLAAGKEYVVEVVNTAIAFFRKTDGVKVFQTTFDSNGFLAGTGIGQTPFSFDPRVTYDRKTGRFYAITLDVDFFGVDSSVILCVSTTGNPNDPWDVYRLNNLIDTGTDAYWGDYPQIGFSNDHIMISTNLFSFFTSSVLGTAFQVIDKAGVINNGTADQTIFIDTARFNARPARTNSPGTDALYAVNYSGTSGADGQYRIYASFDNAGTPNMSFADVLTAGTGRSGGPIAPSKGFSIDNLGTRMMDASYSAGRLVFAHTLSVGGGDNRNSIRWTEFNTNAFPNATPTLRQTGAIVLPGTFHAIQPAIEINALQDIAVVFTRTSPATTPDVMGVIRSNFAPLNTMPQPKKLAASPDFTAFFPSGNRWGDYASVTVDPVDDLTFWGCNEIALSSNMFDWGTVFFKWALAPPSTAGTLPESVTRVFGVDGGGNVASFGAIDADMYSLDSEVINGRGNYAAYELQFQSPLDKASVNQLAFAVDALVVGQSTPGFIYIFNVDTAKWEQRTSTRFTTALGTSRLRISQGKASAYVDGAGKVKIRVMGIQAVRRAGGTAPSFRLQSDQASLVVN